MSNSIRQNEEVQYDLEHDMHFSKRESPCSTEPIKPLSLCFCVWNRCNMKCRICLSNSNSDVSSKLPTEKLLNTISHLAPMRLVWSGGEPTMNDYLPHWIEHAISMGFYNVVTTNLTLGDPLSVFAGEFFYNVSIYAIEKDKYSYYTGKDMFKVFAKNFQEILKRGHKVCANIMITSDWESYLPGYIEWLKKYPIRKLLLSNLLTRGRNLDGSLPAEQQGLELLRSFLFSLNLEFPVIYPSCESAQTCEEGYIVVEASRDSTKFAYVNGNAVKGKRDLLRRIVKLADVNRRLFTLQNYVFYEKCNTT